MVDLYEFVEGASYLEAQDNGPDETEIEGGVAIDNIVGSNVLEMDALFPQELQCLVHILQTMDAHLALGGLGQTFPG